MLLRRLIDRLRPERHTCPRRAEAPAFHRQGDDLDTWVVRDGLRHCSFCGSLHPDEVMAHWLGQTWTLSPTDKSYKAYVHLARLDTEEIDPESPFTSGPYVGKFYFQHLDEGQRGAFIEAYNDGRISVDYPGHLYVAPFFSRRKA